MPVMTIPTARASGGPAAGGSGKITREAVLAAALPRAGQVIAQTAAGGTCSFAGAPTDVTGCGRCCDCGH